MLAIYLWKDTSIIAAMLALLKAGTNEEWKITAVNGDTWEFTAFVKECKEGEMTVDALRTMKATLRISGEPVYTEASEVSV